MYKSAALSLMLMVCMATADPEIQPQRTDRQLRVTKTVTKFDASTVLQTRTITQACYSKVGGAAVTECRRRRAFQIEEPVYEMYAGRSNYPSATHRMWHPSVVLENDRSNHHVNWYDIQSSQMEKARGSVAGNAMYSDVSPRAFFTQLNNAFNWVVPTVTTTVASSTVFTGVTTTTSKQTFGVSKCTPATFAFSDCEAAVKKTPGKWDYDDLGAWGGFCGGAKQSPIDIVSGSATLPAALIPLVLGNFESNTLKKMEMSTNTHTININFPYLSDLPYLLGGGLPGRFIFHAMHFHWGTDSTQGSEHTVDSVKYPAEMHMVFYNSKYADVFEALNYADGLAALGTLIKVQENDNPEFQSIIDEVKLVDLEDKYKKQFTAVKLRNLLPKNANKFYRYSGSLTTPTCNEAVTWTLLQTPVGLSENQLKAFRYTPIKSNNYRPIQALNGRRVSTGLFL